VPKRKQSLHRVYDNNDLKEFLRVTFLYRNGHKISHIATLSSDDIQEIVQTACVCESNYASYIHRLIETGLDLDEEKFGKVVNTVISRIGMEKAIVEVIYPFFERIGLLWMTNHVIPAQEHFVSHIIRNKIISETSRFKPDPSAPTVLLFTPEHERHELPLLVVNYFFRKNGVRTIYLGTQVSRESIREFMAQHPVDLLYLHVVTQFASQELDPYACSLCHEFPKTKIFMSGPAAVRCMCGSPSNLRLITSINEMITLASHKCSHPQQ
jgi:methanogenic corrinoid protein MtbC1